jgi:hypothetical protein
MAITRAQQARQMLKKGSKKPVEQAGVMNFKPSEMVTVPKVAKSSPTHPVAKLAYITDAEKKLLIKKNLHGSLKGKPNRGPGGIPSLEGDFESYTSGMGSGNKSGGGFNERDDLREQASVARTQGKRVPTMKEVREIVKRGADDRGNFLQNRNQQNVIEYNKNLKKIDENKDLNALEKFNAKKRLRNKRFIDRKFTEKAQGIAQAYGLSVSQLKDLLDAYSRDEDQVEFFGKMQDILDMDPSARRLGENFNESIMKGALGEIALSKRMKKGTPLSIAELFSTPDATTRIELPGILQKLQGDPTFSNVLSGLERLKTLDEISKTPGGVKQSDIDNYFNLTMGKGGIDPITGKPVDPLFYQQPGQDRSNESDPCKGPNPPAYCFTGKKAPDTPINPAIARNLGGLSPRIGGSIFDFTNLADGGRVSAMDGGIMDVARQEMFLGGIAKSLKKGLRSAKRAVKKVVKSPFGKAAILAAPFLMSGGLPSFLKGDALKKFFLKNVDKGFSLANLSDKGVFAGIAGLSALAGLTAPKEDEDEFDTEAYYSTGRLNPNPDLFPRILGTQFTQTAADGGRIGYQEGSKEPVAKKTMPLLDMGGKEMDLRDNGGFVPIGRMEKADDVPARLSKNEFVFTAEAVRNAGEGDVDKGAEVMYNMMKNLEAGGEVSEESQGLDGAREMFQTSKRLEEVL